MIAPAITDAYLELVNGLLCHATAEGAYCIGVVSVAAWQQGLEPDKELLEAAAKCDDIPEALEIFDKWKLSLKRKE